MRTSASSVLRWLSRGGAPGATRNARRALERTVREQWTAASLEARLAQGARGADPFRSRTGQEEAR